MKKISLLLLLFIVACLLIPTSCVTRDYQVIEPYAETEYRTETHTEVVNQSQKYIEWEYQRYTQLFYPDLEWWRETAESFIDGYRITTAPNEKKQIKLFLTKNLGAKQWRIQVIDMTGLKPIIDPSPPLLRPYGNALVDGHLRAKWLGTEQTWIDNLNAVTSDPARTLSYTKSEEYDGREIIVDVSNAGEFIIISCATCTPDKTTVAAVWTMSNFQSYLPLVKKVELTTTELKTIEEQVPYQVTKERTVTKTEEVPFWDVWFSK